MYCTHVRPFAKQDRNGQWARQAFAWRYTGGKCTTSTTPASALQEHRVCLEVGSRILVTVTDCGVFNEHVLHGLSVALNVKGGRGFTKQSAVVRRMGVDAAGGHGKKCKHRKLAY